MKNIKLIQKAITDAVEKYNSTHRPQLEFLSGESSTGTSNVRYIANYKFGWKTVHLLALKNDLCFGCTNETDLEYMDEFLETLA